MLPIFLASSLNAVFFDCEMTGQKNLHSLSSWNFKACIFFQTQLSAVSGGSSLCRQKLSNFRSRNSARLAEVPMEERSDNVFQWLKMTVQIRTHTVNECSLSPYDI